MIEPTDEMKAAVSELVDEAMRKAAHAAYSHGYWAHLRNRATDEALAAVLALIERDLRERLADELEEHAIHLRNGALKTGAVGIKYVQGIEGAAYQLRSGDLP